MSEKLSDEEYKQRNVELAVLVQKFNTALKEAEDFAIKYGLHFRIEPAYGMGGTFWGDDDSEDGGWSSSSRSC